VPTVCQRTNFLRTVAHNHLLFILKMSFIVGVKRFLTQTFLLVLKNLRGMLRSWPTTILQILIPCIVALFYWTINSDHSPDLDINNAFRTPLSHYRCLPDTAGVRDCAVLAFVRFVAPHNQFNSIQFNYY
jgi:hypothetical protein